MGGLARDAARAEARHQERRLQPGLIVHAYARTPSEPSPRMRLVVLIRQDKGTGEWKAAMISNNPNYSNGQPRIRLSHWRQAGLRVQAYICSCGLATLVECDIVTRFGYISAQDVRQFSRKCDLAESTVKNLLASVG